MFTVFHLIFGTLLFASTTFIGARDALVVLAKYIGSAAICRIVLMYELAGLRESFSKVNGEKVDREATEHGSSDGASGKVMMVTARATAPL